MLPSLLASLPPFQSVPLDAIQAAAPVWEVRLVPAGTTLWTRDGAGGEWTVNGRPFDGLCIVAQGELSAVVDGVRVGRLPQGELVGEAMAFHPDAGRTADVVAERAARLLVLPRAGLLHLRDRVPRMYDALLQASLRALNRRVAETDRLISRLSEGTDPAPERTRPGPLATLRALVARRDAAQVLPALRRLPVLGDLPEALVAELAPHFEVRSFPDGSTVLLQGDDGSSLFVVTSGRVDVLRAVGEGRAAWLATLEPGALFGTGGLLAALDGQPARRTASCVASGQAVVAELDHATVAHLPDRLLRPLQETLAAALHFQLGRADAILARLADGTPRTDQLHQAASSVQAWSRPRSPGDGVPST